MRRGLRAPTPPRSKDSRQNAIEPIVIDRTLFTAVNETSQAPYPSVRSAGSISPSERSADTTTSIVIPPKKTATTAKKPELDRD
jgi:hypothetical protein